MQLTRRARRAPQGRVRNAVLGLIVATGTVVLVAQASGSGRATAHTPTHATLECPANDLILNMHNVRAPAGGRAATPGAALASELRAEYPGLSAASFAPSRVTRDSVELVLEERGDRLARVVLHRDAGGWGVEDLSACNSLLVKRGGAR